MLFSHLKLSVPFTSTNLLSGTLSLQRFAYVVEGSQFQPSTAQLNCRISFAENVPPLKFVRLSSFKGPHSCKALRSINLEEASHVSRHREQGHNANHSEEAIAARDIMLGCMSDSEERLGVEIQRRRRIGLANKGKVPWNKGRKHSAETCKRIRYRTREALRDPKVREKMSKRPGPPRSNETRARIGASQARRWGERLKWKRSRENFYLLWADNIAKAAKRGGLDQEELDWDSYEKLKRDIALEQLQQAADGAKAKVRAQKKARAKAEESEKFAQKRKDREERAKLDREIKRTTHKKSKEEKEELAVARELKLKERLSKIHRRKSVNGQVTGGDHKAWQSLNLELLKKGRKLNEASLVDQIRAIKSKCAESAADSS